MLTLFTVFNILIYFSYAYLYLWQVGIVTVKPLYWFLTSLGLGFFLLLVKGKLKLQNHASRYLVVWAIFLILAYAMAYVISTKPEAARESMVAMGESALMLILFVYLLQERAVAKAATVAVLVVVIVSVILNFYDFLNPMEGRFTKNLGRAAGMYVNANLSGSMLVFGMALTVWLLPKRIRFLYCVFVALGVLITFSRSSILMWVVAMLTLSWLNAFHLKKIPSLMGMGMIVLALGITLMAGAWLNLFKVTGTDAKLSDDATNRISRSFFEQEDSSARSRVYIAKHALQMYLQAPVFGHGLGVSGKGHKAASVHNMYLLLALQLGVFGLLLMFTLLYILWSANTDSSRLILILYGFAGLFGHNYFEQPAVMLVVALAISGIHGRPAQSKEKEVMQQKAPTSENRRIHSGA